MSISKPDSPSPSETGRADASSGVFLTDPGGIITGWSPGAAGVTGYTAAEIVGRKVAILYDAEQQAEGHPVADLARAARGAHGAGEGWLLQKNGMRIWTSTVFTALRDARGVVSGFACHTRGLAAQKAAESRRRARAEQVAAVSEIGRAHV